MSSPRGFIDRRLLLAAMLTLFVGQAAAPATRAVNYYALTAEQFFKLPEVQKHFTADAVDLPLLDAALFHRTNIERAKENLPLFTYSEKLHAMAAGHSMEMATLHYFDHVSPTPKNATLADRLKNVGMNPRLAGENIAVLPAMEVGSGTYTVAGDPPHEIHIDAKTHKELDYCTYQELADGALTEWMNSPPHKADILNRKFLYLGAAGARGPYDPDQDSFYMTQNFASDVPAARR